ncbi:iron-sulfur cluster-binding domain-containing protein [Chitinophaga filiformis]|uniref:iron-sulfur cluster-binding domain-containing protein n=1 Tax=Chitinophaga filiformis TaxID=104663 RepID=UPI001F41276B|nr:iron-sulfur cluster-binding domain-containing protein [Chitinophaga filiformis]MCF6404839.1 iron-sulfur cluster-binding domain-containing protein [Chitinophaga filiformis]
MNAQIWHTAAIIHETENVVTIVFNTEGHPLVYKPGQFINVTLVIDGVSVTRSYSLSSLPDKDLQPAITVKKVPGGIMSSYIVDNADQIKNWQVTGPFGSFSPTSDTYNADHVVLLAGGSGITPLFSIGRSLIDKSTTTSITLVYSVRSKDEIIFRQAIEDWAIQHPERVKIHYAISQPGDSNIQATSIIKGRINKLVSRKLIKSAVGDTLDAAHYFICGPSGLMNMHKDMLGAQQVPDDNIYMEWFSPEPAADQVDLPAEMQEVLLHFYEQSNLLEVHPGKTILTAALEEKIPLPYSCKVGTCGVCAARITSGKVNMVSNYALRKADLEAGLILLCQSYPLTEDVTVEID